MKTRQIFTWIAILAILLPSLSVAQNSGARFGADSATCVINLSLYREFAKQKNYKDAYKPWKWVFNNCPKAMQSIYLDGLRIMDYKLQNAKTAAGQQNIIDTIMLVYDNRIKYFPVNTATGKSQEGYLLGRKGMDAFLYRQDKPEFAFEILKKAVEIDGKETSIDVMQFYFNSVVAMVQKGITDKSAIVDVYDQLSEMLETSLNSESDSTVIHELLTARNNVEKLFEPYATCDDLVSIYKSKFDANPNDLNLLKKITKILDKKRCTDRDLFFAATENLHKLEPSANSAYMMAVKNMKEENYSQSIDYLKQAITLYDDNEKKARAHYLLGNVYLNLKNYPAARSSAQKVLEIKPGDGNALILIGDAYGLSASSCGDNELTKKVAYWAAVDKYVQAKRIDPTVSEIADKRIASYAPYFPTTETIFFHGLKEGESYRVECWINETTTIRGAK